MIESEHFFAALHVLSEVLPYQKQLSPETRGALWELFPPEAKRDLTPADLQWAVSQRLIDPNPPREMAVSFVFLHYLYPKRDGWPAFDAGPRRLDPQAAVRDERKVFRAPSECLPIRGVLGETESRPIIAASRASLIPIHSGGEGPDGPIPPVWTESNWQGGAGRG
jgi:hypothetical protein